MKTKGLYYIVLKGNSPWQISHDFGISLEDFYKMNPFARKMIHPGDKVMIRPKEKTVYIPRQSEEMLRGVTVTAKRNNKNKNSFLSRQKEFIHKYANKNNNIKQNSKNNFDFKKIIDLGKEKTSNLISNIPINSDFKDDLTQIVKSSSKDALSLIAYGLGRRYDQLKDKFEIPSLETIDPYLAKELNYELRRRNPDIPAYKTPQELAIENERNSYAQSVVDKINRDNKLTYKPSLQDSKRSNLNRNSSVGRYRVHENINLNDYTLGTRNRYTNYDNKGNSNNIKNVDPINDTSGIIISSYNPFFEYGHPLLDRNANYQDMAGKHWNYYYGVDNEGNFVHGDDLSDFRKGATLTKSLAHDVTGAERGNDPYLIKLNYKSGKSGLMNMTSSTKSIDSDHRGRELLVAGNEARLVSGSVEELNEEIQSMKRRHGVDSVKLIELDNGSYSEGLRTDNNKLTSDDINSYFNRNTRNGHFMYLKTNKPKHQRIETITTEDLDPVKVMFRLYKNGGLIPKYLYPFAALNFLPYIAPAQRLMIGATELLNPNSKTRTLLKRARNYVASHVPTSNSKQHAIEAINNANKEINLKNAEIEKLGKLIEKLGKMLENAKNAISYLETDYNNSLAARTPSYVSSGGTPRGGLTGAGVSEAGTPEEPEQDTSLALAISDAAHTAVDAATDAAEKAKTQTLENYNKAVETNTNHFKEGINKAWWRRLFRNKINYAIDNGISGEIFDINSPDGLGVMTLLKMLETAGYDPNKGLTRRGMRRIMKSYNDSNEAAIKARRQAAIGLNNIMSSNGGVTSQIQFNPDRFNPVQIDFVQQLKPERINPGIDFVNNLNSSNPKSNIRMEGSEDLPKWMNND